MNKNTRLVVIVSLVAILLSCDFAGLTKKSDETQPRTYYETLDLATPESAVKTFSEAFQRDDFMCVYLVLAPKTQFRFPQLVSLFQYGDLFQIEYEEEVLDDVTSFSKGIGKGEHVDSGWYLFDQIMLSAKKHSALLIDLSGEVKIIDSKTSETDDGDDAVDVITSVEGIDDDVTFRMVQAPSKRWRVYQVILADGDEEKIPWSVPNEKD